MGKNDVAPKIRKCAEIHIQLLFFKGFVVTFLVSVAKYPKSRQLKFKKKYSFIVGKAWDCELAVYISSTTLEQTEKEKWSQVTKVPPSAPQLW